MGYVSHRKDGISELRVNGYKQIERILKMLLPHIKFKKVQAELLLESVNILQKKILREDDLRKLAGNIVLVQDENYVTKRKRSKNELLQVLGLTP